MTNPLTIVFAFFAGFSLARYDRVGLILYGIGFVFFVVIEAIDSRERNQC